MSINTVLEYWNEAPDSDSVHVIVHSRKKFYKGLDIAWYEFSMDGIPLHELGHGDIVPDGFLRLPNSDYYEFGGTIEEATKSLTENGFTLIVKGNDL